MASSGSSIALLTILFLLSGCGSSDSTSTPVATPQPIIRVEPSGEDKREVGVNPILQPNCGGTATTTNEYERSRSILRTIEIGGGVSVNASGEVGIPGVANASVGTEVAAHYGETYGSQDTIRRNIMLSAREGTNMQHTVREFEIWETGKVVIEVAGQTYRYPYSFRRDFGVEQVESENLGCPQPTQVTIVAQPATGATNTPQPIPIPATSTIAAPTETPMITPAQLPSPTSETANTPIPTFTPEPTSTTSSQPNSFPCTGTISHNRGTRVTVYNQPDGLSIADTLNVGRSVSVTQRETKQSGVWYAVVYEGGGGYVQEGFILLEDDCPKS